MNKVFKCDARATSFPVWIRTDASREQLYEQHVQDALIDAKKRKWEVICGCGGRSMHYGNTMSSRYQNSKDSEHYPRQFGVGG